MLSLVLLDVLESKKIGKVLLSLKSASDENLNLVPLVQWHLAQNEICLFLTHANVNNFSLVFDETIDGAMDEEISA